MKGPLKMQPPRPITPMARGERTGLPHIRLNEVFPVKPAELLVLLMLRLWHAHRIENRPGLAVLGHHLVFRGNETGSDNAQRNQTRTSEFLDESGIVHGLAIMLIKRVFNLLFCRSVQIHRMTTPG